MEGLRVLDWALVSAVAALAAAVAALSRRTARLGGGPGAGQDRLDQARLEGLQAQLEAARAEQERLAQQLARCVQRVGMVRYDAFRESGGRLSFSLALLDGRGDGVVLSVLHGRDGSYAYAKAVRDGKPSHPLSEEEREAVEEALRA
ncbi:MAG: DUF4446 family protein [Armatimonadota bacterium]|nr:DUF4446 family protein [Armatimonadota bacterium]MDW8155640.1 DUF4446 family protein [Armatimonadota bacterium]